MIIDYSVKGLKVSAKKYIIDFRDVDHYSEIHKVIKESLNFPDYYGCNWSAFWDCLTDLYGEPIHIEIVGFDVLAQEFEDAADQIVTILKRFKHYEKSFEEDIQIEFIRGSKRIEIE